MQTELIIVSEYCHKCQIEPSFIDLLQEEGLIEIRTEGDEHYLLVSQLPEVTLQPDVLRFIYQYGRYRCYPSSSGENGGDASGNELAP